MTVIADATGRMVFSGRELTWSAGCEKLRPMTGREAIVAGGGLLVKSAEVAGLLHLRVEPNFREGQRVYHYGMTLPDEAQTTLTGDVTPNGVAWLPGRVEFDADQLRRLCIRTARAFVEAGLSPQCPLRDVCRNGLVEAGAFEQAPATVGELAETT